MWIIQFPSMPRQNRSSLLPAIYLIMYLVHLEIFWKSLKRKFLSELLYFCRTHICSSITNFAVLYIFVKLHVFCIPITWVYWENIYISNLLKMKYWYQQLHCCIIITSFIHELLTSVHSKSIKIVHYTKKPRDALKSYSSYMKETW